MTNDSNPSYANIKEVVVGFLAFKAQANLMNRKFNVDDTSTPRLNDLVGQVLSVVLYSTMGFNEFAKPIIYPLPRVVLKFDGFFLNANSFVIRRI